MLLTFATVCYIQCVIMPCGIQCGISISIILVGGAQQLTLTSQPQASGTYCPGPVTFTCVGTQISALLWRVNGSTVTAYIFQCADEFPLYLNFPLDGVMAAITSASIVSLGCYDITSVLNVSDVSVLNRTSLQCAASLSQSDIIHIQVNTQSKSRNYIPAYAW